MCPELFHLQGKKPTKYSNLAIQNKFGTLVWVIVPALPGQLMHSNEIDSGFE